MGLISGMNEEEIERYGKLIEAFEKAEETGKRQQFSCVGLRNVVHMIDGKGNVYDKNGKFLFRYITEILKEMPKDNN